MSDTNSESQWRSGLRQLGTAAEPQRDLWPSIEARIALAPRRSRWPKLVAAAGVLLSAGGAGVVAWHVHSGVEDAPEIASTALEWAQPENPKLAAAAQDLDNASAQLQQALEQHPDAVFLVGLLNRTNGQRMRLLQTPAASDDRQG